MKALFLIITIGIALVNFFVFRVGNEMQLFFALILIWIGTVLIDIRNKLKNG